MKPKVAIIGGGVAGLVSAWRLRETHEVHLFEAGSRLGGHTNTIFLEKGPDAGMGVDTGFIVLNDVTYPLFTEFLNELGVGVRYADMAFSVHVVRTGLQYCSRDLAALFAQRRNLFNPRFLKMLLELNRFWKISSEALKNNSIGAITLAEFLGAHSFGNALRYDFLYPLAAAVWSSSEKQLDAFPAQTFLTFFRNHGWLSYANQPKWQTVVGGSYEYVRQFEAKFEGTIHLDAPVEWTQVSNMNGLQHEVFLGDGQRLYFDKVVIATHADHVLDLLPDASVEEKEVFSSWKYALNRTILHTDASFMPPEKRAWASWNYTREPAENGHEPVSVTYDMNCLQGLPAKDQYFVTLNPRREPKKESFIREFAYMHPIYTAESVATQQRLAEMNGKNGRWFCGSYCGFGFHEDAVRSAEFVASHINGGGRL